jgi:hypothetical protein
VSTIVIHDRESSEPASVKQRVCHKVHTPPCIHLLQLKWNNQQMTRPLPWIAEPGGLTFGRVRQGVLGRTRCAVRHINVPLRLPPKLLGFNRIAAPAPLLVKGDYETAPCLSCRND